MRHKIAIMGSWRVGGLAEARAPPKLSWKAETGIKLPRPCVRRMLMMASGPLREGDTAMEWASQVKVMAANVKAKVKELRRDGVVAMSYGNLRQIVSTNGITVAPARFDELLRDAVKSARCESYFYA